MKHTVSETLAARVCALKKSLDAGGPCTGLKRHALARERRISLDD